MVRPRLPGYKFIDVMSFFERFKFYLIGVFAGSLLVILMFGRRNSCKDMVTGYLPNGRVLLEVKSKPLFYSNDALIKLNESQMDTAEFRKNILPELDIDFKISDQRAKPCGQYVSYYQDSLYNWQVNFEKCSDKVEIQQIINQLSEN